MKQEEDLRLSKTAKRAKGESQLDLNGRVLVDDNSRNINDEDENSIDKFRKKGFKKPRNSRPLNKIGVNVTNQLSKGQDQISDLKPKKKSTAGVKKHENKLVALNVQPLPVVAKKMEPKNEVRQNQVENQFDANYEVFSGEKMMRNQRNNAEDQSSNEKNKLDLNDDNISKINNFNPIKRKKLSVRFTEKKNSFTSHNKN